jgi:pilus assembly protein Flp/PilA
MTKLASSVQRFLVSEDGPTAVEYALMVALIAVVAIVGATLLGTAVNDKFNQISSAISST